MSVSLTPEQLDMLRRARARIADPVRWTQGAYARDAYGHPIAFDSPDAHRWCARGAIFYEAGEACWPILTAIYLIVRGTLESYNDSHSHASVLAVLDHAIASASIKTGAP